MIFLDKLLFTSGSWFSGLCLRIHEINNVIKLQAPLLTMTKRPFESIQSFRFFIYFFLHKSKLLITAVLQRVSDRNTQLPHNFPDSHRKYLYFNSTLFGAAAHQHKITDIRKYDRVWLLQAVGDSGACSLAQTVPGHRSGIALI